MIRRYGKEPYRVAVIHGGPGALGSLACVARELSKTLGVLEPIQSKYTIEELIIELHRQIAVASHEPMILVGHSWGAWLSLLYAAKHPNKVERLVLIGCAPFEERYVPQIMERRLKNLDSQERLDFQDLLSKLENHSGESKDDLMAQLEQLVKKTDNYDMEEDSIAKTDIFTVDAKMYSSIWSEAAELRRNGGLLQNIEKLACPVTVLHGENDPHPIAGITEPLTNSHVNYEQIVFPFCGHSPFLEKLASKSFYDILLASIQKD